MEGVLEHTLIRLSRYAYLIPACIHFLAIYLPWALTFKLPLQLWPHSWTTIIILQAGRSRSGDEMEVFLILHTLSHDQLVERDQVVECTQWKLVLAHQPCALIITQIFFFFFLYVKNTVSRAKGTVTRIYMYVPPGGCLIMWPTANGLLLIS